ncbi:MAG: MFS transporter [Thermoflexales bacterium]
MLTRIEDLLVGPAAIGVRRNMRIELMSSLAFAPYQAALVFIPVILQRLDAGPNVIALYQSASYVGFFLVPFASRFMPARNLQRFLAWVWAAGRVFFGLIGLAVSAPAILALTMAGFFLESFPSAAYTRVIQQIYPANIRGRAMGFVRLGLAAGSIAATPLCGWVLDKAGYSVLFPVCGFLAIFSAWIFSHIRIEESPVARPESRALAALWRVVREDRRYRFYLLAVIAFGFGGLIPTAFYPAVIVNRLNLSYTDISLLGAVQSIVWLGGYLLWGHVIDRTSGVRTVRILFAVMSIIPAAYLFATSGWMLVPASIAQGLGSAGIDLSFQQVTIELAPNERTYEDAVLVRTVIGIRGLIGPLLGVWFSTLGMPPTAIFALGSSLYLLAAVLMLSPVFRVPRGTR